MPSDPGVTFTRVLPLANDREVLNFLVKDSNKVKILFEILPTFGSHIIASGLVIPEQLLGLLEQNRDGEHGLENYTIPLFENTNKLIGTLSFNCFVTTPFQHPALTIGGKVETYWKSTKLVPGHAKHHDHENVHSLITASSLSEEYMELVVQYTKDGVVVIFPDLFISHQGLQFELHSLTYAQAKILFEPSKDPIAIGQLENEPCSKIIQNVYSNFYTLEEVLNVNWTNLVTSSISWCFHCFEAPYTISKANAQLIVFARH